MPWLSRKLSKVSSKITEATGVDARPANRRNLSDTYIEGALDHLTDTTNSLTSEFSRATGVPIPQIPRKARKVLDLRRYPWPTRIAGIAAMLCFTVFLLVGRPSRGVLGRLAAQWDGSRKALLALFTALTLREVYKGAEDLVDEIKDK